MKDVLPRLQVLAAALTSIGAVIALGRYFFPASPTTAALVLLLAVLLSGAFARPPEATVISAVAAFCLDYFFIPPVGHITVADSQDWVALAVFLITSMAASNISHRFRRQREELIQHGRETEKLHALSRSMLLGSTAEEVSRTIVNKCMELFGFREMVLFDATTHRFYRSQENSTISDERLRRAARLKLEDDSGDGVLVQAVSLGNVILGSMATRGPAQPDTTIKAIANTVAVGLAQAQAQTAAGQAEAVRKSEELKSVMIDALAHDLKSPLTAIEASAEMLAESTRISAEQRADLLAVIREEARGLRRLIEEAIHLARIDAGRLRLASKPEPVRDLVDSAMRSLGDRLSGRELTIDIPGDIESISVDRDLMVQAIKQLLDNALKYSPPHGPIAISAREVHDQLLVAVRDAGPGLTELEQARVFDKFYRGRYDRSAVQGTGMGLAIAKEIVEAHGGSVGVRSRVGQGSEFFIALRTGARW